MEKRATLVVLPILLWITTIYFVLWPWMRTVDQADPLFSHIAQVNAAVWWLVLLWALHHLSFQLGALCDARPHENPVCDARPHANPASRYPQEPEIAILYATRDDFDEEAILSCLEQDHWALRVYICDDSEQGGYRNRIDQFARARGSCEVVRRKDRVGFKAGNLNHALRNVVGPTVEWVLIVDADQRLPRDYVSRLVRLIPHPDRPEVVFIQGAHAAHVDNSISVFQRSLAPEVRLFYQRDLALRQRYGFVPLLGHGALIRRSACLDLGGFPELVSEDFGLALRAAREGKRGIYAGSVESLEAYPYDLGAFLTRLGKFSGGSAELMRRELGPFFLSRISTVEKWDFAMAMLWYILMPLLLINGFLSAYVVHKLWDGELPHLHPILPYAYAWLLLVLWGLCRSVSRTWGEAIRFYFWSSAIYTSVLPICAWAVVKHLFVAPRFHRTPKGTDRTRVPIGPLWLTGAVGVLAVIAAVVFRSPFSPVLAGQGVAFLGLGLFTSLCCPSVPGRVARVAVYLPGVLYLAGLYAVWAYARG